MTKEAIQSTARATSSVIFGIFVLICSVMAGFAPFATNADYYMTLQSRLDVNGLNLGLETDDNLMAANRCLADFMGGRREDMQLTLEIYGSEMSVWSPQAVRHMKDVRDLVSVWTTVAIAGGVYIAGYLTVNMGTARGRRRAAKAVLVTYAVVLAAVAILAAAVMIVGFDEMFTLFHKVFFTNDEWLFPQGDLLVRMLPEQFFANMALTGGVAVALISLVIAGAAALTLSRGRTRAKGEIDG